MRWDDHLKDMFRDRFGFHWNGSSHDLDGIVCAYGDGVLTRDEAIMKMVRCHRLPLLRPTLPDSSAINPWEVANA